MNTAKMKRAASPAPPKAKIAAASPKPLETEKDVFKPEPIPARYPRVTDKAWLVPFLLSFLVVVGIRKFHAPVGYSGKWISYDDIFKFAFDVAKEDAPAVLLPLLGASLVTMILLNAIAIFSKPIVSLSFFATPIIFIWSLMQWSKATVIFSAINEKRIILIATLLLLSLLFKIYLGRRSNLHRASEAMKAGCYILGKPSTLASHLLLNIAMLSIWGLWGKYVVRTVMMVDLGANKHINDECDRGRCGFSPVDFWDGASSIAGIFCSLQLIVYTGAHFALWNMIVGRHTATQFFCIPSSFFSCAFDTIAHGTGTAAAIGGIFAILSTIHNAVDRMIRSLEPPGCWFASFPLTFILYIVKWLLAGMIDFFNYFVPLVAGITCQPLSQAVSTTKEHIGNTHLVVFNTMWWICKVMSLCSFPIMLWIVTKTSAYLHPAPGWMDWSRHEFVTFVVALVLCIVLMESTLSSLLDVAMSSAFCGSIRDKTRPTDTAEIISPSKFASVPVVLFGTAVFLILSHMANLPYMQSIDFCLARFL